MESLYTDQEHFNIVVDKMWELRHDDEVWTVDGEYVLTVACEELAHYVIYAHNKSLRG